MEEQLVRKLRETRAQRDRNAAEDLVRWLLEEPDPKARRELVESSHQFHQWAVAERLCEESAKAAAGSAAKALEMARLALCVAELAPGDPVWSERLQGYVWLFIANARRVGGDMPAAAQGFAKASQLWEAGSAADPGLLATWRLPDLESSLRRTQGKFEEALSLHEKALALAPPEVQGRVLLKKAGTLEQMGDPERAIVALNEAEPRIDGVREPQSVFGLQFNRAVNYCHLERFAEAEALLRPIGEMALELGHELNKFRLLLAAWPDRRRAWAEERGGGGFRAGAASIPRTTNCLRLREGHPGARRALPQPGAHGRGEGPGEADALDLRGAARSRRGREGATTFLRGGRGGAPHGGASTAHLAVS